MSQPGALDRGLDKLQDVLLSMAPGDEINVGRAAEVSGLNDELCQTVLERLKNVGLMVRQNGAYVRRRAVIIGD